MSFCTGAAAAAGMKVDDEVIEILDSEEEEEEELDTESDDSSSVKDGEKDSPTHKRPRQSYHTTNNDDDEELLQLILNTTTTTTTTTHTGPTINTQITSYDDSDEELLRPVFDVSNSQLDSFSQTSSSSSSSSSTYSAMHHSSASQSSSQNTATVAPAQPRPTSTVESRQAAKRAREEKKVLDKRAKKIASIRQKIQSGHYKSLEVSMAMSRTMRESPLGIILQMTFTAHDRANITDLPSGSPCQELIAFTRHALMPALENSFAVTSSSAAAHDDNSVIRDIDVPYKFEDCGIMCLNAATLFDSLLDPQREKQLRTCIVDTRDFVTRLSAWKRSATAQYLPSPTPLSTNPKLAPLQARLILLIYDYDGSLYRTSSRIAGISSSSSSARPMDLESRANVFLTELMVNHSIDEIRGGADPISLINPISVVMASMDTRPYKKQGTTFLSLMPSFKSFSAMDPSTERKSNRNVDGVQMTQIFINQLKCFPRVTDEIAAAVVEVYPTFRRLFEAFNADPDTTEEKVANILGLWKRKHTKMARLMKTVFLNEDAGEKFDD